MNFITPALQRAYLDAASDAWRIIAAAPLIAAPKITIGVAVRNIIECNESTRLSGDSGVIAVYRRRECAPAALWVAVSNAHPYLMALFRGTPYVGGAWRFALAKADGAWANQPANFGPVRAKAVLLDPEWCIAHLPDGLSKEATRGVADVSCET